MKNIPILLKNHYLTYATTWCYIMRVAFKGKHQGMVRGFTSLDVPITFDDGQGPVLYNSDNGFMPARIQTTADFSVDNTDIKGWVSDDGITEADIIGGIFDGAEVTIMRINYMRPQDGFEIVNFGHFGETQWNDTQWKCEFRSLMQQAKQPFGEVYSLTCRNQYGDKKCKKEFVWFEATINVLDDDPMLLFQSDDLDQAEGFFAPGVVEVLTGANAGADMDIDEFHAGGVVRLALAMNMPFQVGDTVRVRQDCDKLFETCRDEKDNVLEFRGEHLTPVADTGLQVPGAYVQQEGAT